ncbi:MAG TPA: hypothetical protein VF447_09395 [Terriglobales bacterium]
MRDGLIADISSSRPLRPLRLVVLPQSTPIVLDDSILYIFVSDDANDTNIDIKDKATGTRLTFNLPAQHAAVALIGKKEKAVIAKYGF